LSKMTMMSAFSGLSYLYPDRSRTVPVSAT
jgi:hypothetical protein